MSNGIKVFFVQTDTVTLDGKRSKPFNFLPTKLINTCEEFAAELKQDGYLTGHMLTLHGADVRRQEMSIFYKENQGGGGVVTCMLSKWNN